MATLPQTDAQKPWNPPAQAAPAVPRADIAATKPAEAPAVHRRSISLADFADVKRDVDDEKNHLFVPPEIIPDGLTVEWKRMMVFNKEDKKHRAELHRAGWRHIPSNTSGFSEHFASFVAGDIFEYEGLTLMYRPKKMSDQARADDTKRAGAVVQAKMEEIGLATSHRDIPGKRFTVNRGYEEKLAGGNPEAVAVPD